jgi:hypothetical protein
MKFPGRKPLESFGETLAKSSRRFGTENFIQKPRKFGRCDTKVGISGLAGMNTSNMRKEFEIMFPWTSCLSCRIYGSVSLVGNMVYQSTLKNIERHQAKIANGDPG